MDTRNAPPDATLPEIPHSQLQALRWVQGACDLMDNRFRIPGTQIRFGLDAVVGLVPYVGDMAGFAISGVMVLIMARYGASGMLVVRMLGNVALDSAAGTVPLLGDIFDLRFRANRRNFKLLQAHYAEGKYRGGAWWLVLLALGLLVAMAFALFYVVIRVVAAIGLHIWGWLT